MVSLLSQLLISKPSQRSVLMPQSKTPSDLLSCDDDDFLDCDEKPDSQAMNLPKNSAEMFKRKLGSSSSAAQFKGPGAKFQSKPKHQTKLVLKSLQNSAPPKQSKESRNYQQKSSKPHICNNN